MCPNAQILISLPSHFLYVLKMGEQNFNDNFFRRLLACLYVFFFFLV